MADLTSGGKKGFAACMANIFPLRGDCSFQVGDSVPQTAGLLEIEATWDRQEAEEKLGRLLGGGFCYSFTFQGFNKAVDLRIRICSACASTQALWFDAVALTDAGGDTIGVGYKVASESSSNFCSVTPVKKLGVEIFQPIVENTGPCATTDVAWRKHIFPSVTDISTPMPLFSNDETSYIEFSGKGYGNPNYNKGPLLATTGPAATALPADVAWAWQDMPAGFTLPTVADDCVAVAADQASV